MKVPFYILGLLIRYGAQSGYSLKQIIEKDISDFAHIKLSNIYYHLEKLFDKGYVTMEIDKDGNRPEKQVYTITESGKKYFNILMEKQLNEKFILEFSLDGVLYFKDMIEEDVFIKSLENSREEIKSHIKFLKEHKKNTLDNMNEKGKASANAIFDHSIIHLEAEFLWIEKLLGVK